jgi:hypothetical protein
MGVVVPDSAVAMVGLASVPAIISEANDVATSFCIMAPFEFTFNTGTKD